MNDTSPDRQVPIENLRWPSRRGRRLHHCPQVGAFGARQPGVIQPPGQAENLGLQFMASGRGLFCVRGNRPKENADICDRLAAKAGLSGWRPPRR